MKEPWEFQERVDKGCKLLNERLGPEWVNKIDLAQLNLQSNCACILGQTSIDIAGKPNSYHAAAYVLFPDQEFPDRLDSPTAEEHGFVLFDDLAPWNYLALTECWTQTIAARRSE